jgi:hypothetical protein
MGDTAKLAAGPCLVLVDMSGVDTDVGYTKGGITIRRNLRLLDLMADELGDDPGNQVIVGNTVDIQFAFAEESLVNLRRTLLDSVTLQDDVTSSKQAVEVRSLTGRTTASSQRKWTFKPIDPATGVATTDQNKWITAYKAAPTTESFELIYKHDEQRVIPITLRCFADSANKNRKIRFGDPTITDANESGFTNW